MINNLTAPLHETPLTFWENFAAADATKRKKHEIRLARAASKGYFRGTLLPCLMWVAYGIVAIIACCYGDSSTAKPDSETTSAYNEATEAYYNGDFEKAAGLLKPRLQKNPQFSHGQILMAKIQFAKGNKDATLQHLKNAREYTLDRTEIDQWIARLDGSFPDESKASTSPNLSGKSSPSK
jgi:tetratricopeptide (TPR) repeat protein